MTRFLLAALCLVIAGVIAYYSLLQIYTDKAFKMREDKWGPFSQRQEYRKRLVRQYCEKNARVDAIVPAAELYPSRKIFYCITPKVASRYWRVRLQEVFGGHKLFQDLPKANRSWILQTHFKVMFVREPFERLLSAYKYVFTKRGHNMMRDIHGKAILKQSRPNCSREAFKRLDDITFPEFIEYILKNGSTRQADVMDFHWDNYEMICDMCGISYDIIGHYETLREDSIEFDKKVDARGKLILKHFRESSTHSELLRYYSLIPLDWIIALGDLYKSSFEMFGYPFPGPLEALFKPNRSATDY